MTTTALKTYDVHKFKPLAPNHPSWWVGEVAAESAEAALAMARERFPTRSPDDAHRVAERSPERQFRIDLANALRRPCRPDLGHAAELARHLRANAEGYERYNLPGWSLIPEEVRPTYERSYPLSGYGSAVPNVLLYLQHRADEAERELVAMYRTAVCG